MLTLRYYFRLFQAFINRFKALLIIGVVIGAGFFTFLFFVFPILFSGTTEKIGYVGRYTTDNLPREVLLLAAEGLTKIGSDGNPVPALADRWDQSDDGKVWTFHIDPTKFWQDGKKVTSDSLTYSFADVDIQRPDANTITFRLKERFSPFPSVVASPNFKKGFLGTGKWKVTKLTLAGNFVETMILEDKESNKKILKFYPTEDQAKLAFKLGQIDVIRDVFETKGLSTWNVIHIEEQVVSNRYVAVFFNNETELFDKNKELRQALSYAIDKPNLSPNRALGPISPDSWAYNSQMKDYNYDLKRAKELLAEIPKETRENISLNLSTPSNLLPIAEKIVKNWQDLGINASVTVSQGVPTDYQALLAIYDSPFDPDQYIMWHSSQLATNISRFNNPRIDKLLEDGRLETDKNERKKIYLDFQRYLLEEAPAAFLYHPISYTITRK